MRKSVVTLGLAVVLISSGYVWSQDGHEKHKEHPDAGQQTARKTQTTCPVMGGKIDKKVYADYDGKRVYFCCAGCIPQFKKDPGTYLEKLETEGIAPENIPTAADAEKKEAPKAKHQHGGH